MALDNAKNFAKVTVATGYDSSATSIVLTTGHGAKLPTAPFNVVWWNSTDYADPADDPNVEIVRVTNVSGDTLTVTRAQESTSASTKNTAGKTYKMIAGATAKLLSDIASSFPNETTTTIGTLINGATAKATPVDADMVGLMDSAASNVLKKLSWANIKATLKAYFDTLYAAAGSGGGGWLLVAYGTASGVDGPNITGLDLDAHKVYKVIVRNTSQHSSGVSVAMRVNSNTGNIYSRIRHTLSYNTSGEHEIGVERDQGYMTLGNYLGKFWYIELELSKQGDAVRIKYSGTTYQIGDGADNKFENFMGSGTAATSTNVTSAKVYGSSGTSNWEYWVFRPATS